jgi:ParB family chromosome partitioning protein
MENQLAHFNRAKSELALATKIDEVKDIRDKAEALRAYMKQAGESLEMQNQCAEIKIRCERKGGMILKEQEKNEGGRPPKTGNTMLPVSPNTYEELGIEKMQASRWQAIADIPEEKFEERIAELKAGGQELTSAEMLRLSKGLKTHVGYNSGDNEWYTPPDLIEAARKVMGGIDLDPASSVIANKTVKAKKIYTAEDDGLSHKWSGRVWMNPPYAQPLITQFSVMAVGEFRAGRITQACILVNNATETEWFQTIMTEAAAICFLKGRVKYLDPEGNPSGAPLQGQAVLYLGEKVKEFQMEFEGKGQVMIHAR